MRLVAKWSEYLDHFHAERAGVTEAVFAHLDGRGGRVGEWILSSALPDGVVLDVACGSAPLWARLAGRWVGVDRAAAELTLARRRGASPLVRGDARALPIASERLDAVVCSMALMLLQPLDAGVAELARVSRRGARVVVVAPATAPLTLRDRTRYARLLLALRRRRLDFPNDPSRLDRALVAGGFDVVESDLRRFSYEIDGVVTAELLVESLYLPYARPEHVARGLAVTRRWIGSSIGIPLRRIVAVRRA